MTAPVSNVVPAGFVLMPVEPTPEMLDAAGQALSKNGAEGNVVELQGDAHTAYASMVAAAPAAPQAAPDLPARLNQLDRMLADCRLTDSHPARQFLCAILLDACGTSAAPAAQVVPVAGEWVSVDERLPELKDNSVLAYFDHGSIDMVHIQDYFAPITNGVVDGEQQYTCWYLKQGVTHWQALPPAPGSAK